MSDLPIRAELVERLEQIAAAQHRSVEAVLEDMLEQYAPAQEGEYVATERKRNPLEALIGAIDSTETDLSVTVRETLAQYTHPQ